MPSAGAVAPPVIRPLRQPIPGRSNINIDTQTYLEVFTDTPHCKIYFTTDGTKPSAFQSRSGKESTFRYRAPFCLSYGRRTIKCIAVSRDGLRQSDVVSRSFIVEDVNGPEPSVGFIDDDVSTAAEVCSEIDDVVDFRDRSRVVKYRKSNKRPPREIVEEVYEETIASDDECCTDRTIIRRSQSHSRLGGPPRSTTEVTTYTNCRPSTAGCHPMPPPPPPQVIVEGNRLAMSGRPVCPVPPPPVASSPYHQPPPPIYAPNMAWSQQAQPINRLGYMTDKMIRGLEESRDFTIHEMRRAVEEARRTSSPPPPPVFQYPQPPQEPLPQQPPQIEQPVVREPPLHSVSPGNGLWREQIEHCYAHLLQYAKDHVGFRVAIAEPRMGDISGLEFEETEDSYVLKLEFTRFDQPFTPAVREKQIAPKKHIKGPRPPTTVQIVKPPPPKRDETPPSPVKVPVKKPEPPKPKPPAEKPKPPKESIDSYLKTEEDQNCEGTIKEVPYFSAEKDAEKLRKAMKGLGTDEKMLIAVLGARSAVQRVEIAKKFKFMYGKDLIENLKGETSGNFQDCLVALAMAPAEYDATCIRNAVVGAGTDEDCLIEIVCTRTNAQLAMVKQTYKKRMFIILFVNISDFFFTI